LQALYGAPEGKSVGDYWFATSVDRVLDRQNDLEHSFVYGYLDGQKSVEVLKLRRNRKGNPEYWEPEGPLAKYSMNMAEARARPIPKDVVYLDFRAELSAFARFFHYPDEGRLLLLDKLKKARDSVAGRVPTRARRYSKQDYIRARSKIVRKLLDGLLNAVFSPGSKGAKKQPKNKAVEHLSDKDIETLNWILDKDYSSGRILEHGLYGNQWGKTVVFTTPNSIGKEYSEAFAGSGEVALTILVHALGRCPLKSLVLLDEPEISLHPTAQDRLQRYLLDQVLSKKLQMVISTHSPRFVQGLPSTAIKVFRQHEDGLVAVHTGYTPAEAFREVAEHADKRLLLVEDSRAAILLECGLRQAGSHVFESHSVQPSPGGVAEIYMDIGVYCRDPGASLLIILDGDQRPSEGDDPDELPHGASQQKLTAEVAKRTAGNDERGPEVRWVGASEDARNEHVRQYLSFLHKRVRYLPGRIPEVAVWDDAFASRTLELLGVKDSTFLSSLCAETDYKRRFEMMAHRINGAETADSLYRTFVTNYARLDAENGGPLSELVAELRNL
jgi:hypothetical protein